jgi:hypothetical protein
MEESIYNLLPPPKFSTSRGTVPRTEQHFASAAAAPTYTTFPAARNISGHTTGASLFGGRAAVMGRVIGDDVQPGEFLRSKHDAVATLAEVSKGPGIAPFAREDSFKRAAVPLRSEKPVMGLTSEKDFVKSNVKEAVSHGATSRTRSINAAASPNRTAATLTTAELPDFAKTPAYLARRNAEIAAGKDAVAAAVRARAAQAEAAKAQYMRRMDDDERAYLAQGLRARWAEKHAQYQSLPFARDTPMQIARKEELERELKEIERSLERLDRPVLFVHRDDTPGIANYAKYKATTEAESVANKMVKEALQARSTRAA